MSFKEKEFEKKLDELRNIISSLTGEIENVLQSKHEFINQEKHRRGVVELEAKIRKIEAEKEQFLKSFDSEESRQNRKRAHREIWLKHRGVA